MTARIYAIRIPTTDDIRAKYAETGSVPITAARCGVTIDIVRDALMPRPK